MNRKEARVRDQDGTLMTDDSTVCVEILLMDDMRMGGDQQPLEGFLGRVVPEMGHPKP